MRSHVGKIVLLCALSDMILIGAGVGGASVLVERYPTFVHAVLYLGLAYLAWFGINALRRAFAGPRNARRARRHGRAAAAERPRDRADDARVHVAQPARVSRHVPADRHGRRTRAGRRAARVRDRRDDGQRRVVPRPATVRGCWRRGSARPWRGACWMARSAAWCCFSRRCSCADRLTVARAAARRPSSRPLRRNAGTSTFLPSHLLPPTRRSASSRASRDKNRFLIERSHTKYPRNGRSVRHPRQAVRHRDGAPPARFGAIGENVRRPATTA